MNYTALLKYIREELCVTQMELADMLEVSFASVNRWENDRFEPTMKAKRKIKELCKKNKIKMEDFRSE